MRASTASAPPTPIASIPSPPALGVWESVPSIRSPGLHAREKGGGWNGELKCDAEGGEEMEDERSIVLENDLMDDTGSGSPELWGRGVESSDGNLQGGGKKNERKLTSIPYFFAADSRKSKTSLLVTIDLCRKTKPSGDELGVCRRL